MKEKMIDFNESDVPDLSLIKEGEKIKVLDNTCDETGDILQVYLERCLFKGRSMIKMIGQVAKGGLDSNIVSCTLGYHKPSKHGQDTVYYGLKPYSIKGLIHIIAD
jgi:hypothetical protein